MNSPSRVAAAFSAMTPAECQDLFKELRSFAEFCLWRSRSTSKAIIVADEELFEESRRRLSNSDDLVGEAINRALDGRRKWDGKKPLAAWLKGVVRSVASEGVPRSKRSVRSPDLSSLLRKITPKTSSRDFRLLLWDLVVSTRELRQQKDRRAGGLEDPWDSRRSAARDRRKKGRLVEKLREVDPTFAREAQKRWRLGPFRSVFAPTSVDWTVVFNDQLVRLVEWIRRETGRPKFSEIGELLDFAAARVGGRATVRTGSEALRVRYHDHRKAISRQGRQPESVGFWTGGRAGVI